MWQRWNQGTHIFEKSTDNGASWSPLGLSGSIITEGTIPDARLSSNIIKSDVTDQTVSTPFRVQGNSGIADLQLYDAYLNRLWRLLSYQNEFKAWEGSNDNFSVNTLGVVKARAGYLEFGRANQQGQRYGWAPLILTSAGHNCGGAISAFYSLVGFQLWWSCYAVNITVPAGSFPYLLITNPPGLPPISGFTDQPLIRCFVPGIGDEPGYVQVDANYIQCYRMKAVAWPAGVGHLIGQGFYWIG